jgi:hypothetical protein
MGGKPSIDESTRQYMHNLIDEHRIRPRRNPVIDSMILRVAAKTQNRDYILPRNHSQDSQAQIPLHQKLQRNDEILKVMNNKGEKENLKDNSLSDTTQQMESALLYSNKNIQPPIEQLHHGYDELNSLKTAASSIQSKERLVPSNVKGNASVFEHRLFSLPSNVQFRILSFVLDDWDQLRMVSSLWYVQTMKIMEQKFKDIDRGFVRQYHRFFHFADSYTTTSHFNKDKNGFRMDHNITAKILPALEGEQIL